MSALMEKVHGSLEELETLVDKTEDPIEREGLKAFIECVTPHLMEDATASFLGKITRKRSGDIDPTAQASSSKEALELLRKDFDIVIE